MSIAARYTSEDLTSVAVSLGEGDYIGSMRGPTVFGMSLPSPGNAEHDALMALVEAGEVTIAAYDPPAPAIPETISDRQFAQALAHQGVISRDEALAFVKRGEVPAALQVVIDAIDDPDQRFDVDMAVSGATTFDRSNPSTLALATALGWSGEQMDALWRYAASLP